MKILPKRAALGAALLIAGCQNPSSDPNPARHHAHSPMSAAAAQGIPPAYVPPGFQASLGQVYSGHLAMRKALDRGDLRKAKEVFQSMHTVLHMVPLEGLDSSSRAYWESADARIMASLHPLAASESLDSVRTYFGEFSAVIQEAARKFGVLE